MAAPNFPNTPTVGQSYTAPNGFVYSWDGKVWGAPLGQVAGGSLAGTYPNPTIAPSAVRGTPSSGGTAREIQKASIWGGDDLIDLSVPKAKFTKDSALYIPANASDTTAVQLPAASTFIKQVSLAVDPGRSVFLYLRCCFRVLASTSTLGTGMTISMQSYSGGTANTADGTLVSSETSPVVVLSAVGQCVHVWYPFMIVVGAGAVTTTPYLWKFFAWTSDATNYQLHKWIIGMQVWQFT